MSLNRRSFLKLAGAATVAAGFPMIVRAETLGLAGGVAPSNRINLGVIGCGGQGGTDMSQAVNDNGVRIVAACDVDAGHLDAFSAQVDSRHATPGICRKYSDFRELIAQKDVDGVIITTPDHWHALNAVAAANAGKHIYCEKPAASSIPEGRAMVDAIRRTGVVCQIGSMQRSMWTFQRVIDLTHNGYLGKIKRVRAGIGHPWGYFRDKNNSSARHSVPPKGLDYEGWVGPAAYKPYNSERCHWNWRWCFDYGAGQLGDWIGHHYDIATVVAGVSGEQPVSIEKIKHDRPPAFSEMLYDTPPSCSFEAHYANGVVIECAVSGGGPLGTSVYGTEGDASADRGWVHHSSKALESVVIPRHKTFAARTAGASHMANFLECVRNGAKPRCPIEEGHNVAAVAHLANAGIRSGLSTVKWNPKTETLIDSSDAETFVRRTYRSPWAFPA